MSGHTPGPWGAHGAFVVGPDGRLVVAASGKELTGESDANARLIAAAPELLAALVWMVEHDDTYEGDTPLPDHHGLTWNEINAEFIEGLNKARAAIAKATQP